MKKLIDYDPCKAGYHAALGKTIREAYATAPILDAVWIARQAIAGMDRHKLQEVALRYAEAVAHLGTDASRDALRRLRLHVETGMGYIAEIRAAAYAAYSAAHADAAAAAAAADAAYHASNAAYAAVAYASTAYAYAYAARAADAAADAAARAAARAADAKVRAVLSVDRICELLELDPEELIQ